MIDLSIRTLSWVLNFTGEDVLRLLFGDRFYSEVKSAGLLDPTVIRPKLSLQPSQPTQACAEPQCMVLKLVETVCSELTCRCFIYQFQIPDLELHLQQAHQLLLSKRCHHNKVQSYCTCNSFAPKTSVDLGMRQIMHLCHKLLTLNCMIDGTYRPNWWSEVRSTAEGDNRNQEYKAFCPPSRWPSSRYEFTQYAWERELAPSSYTYSLWIPVFTNSRSQ